ncbi:MAG: CPBP family intramembrane metalloprotease [Planctomycetota bacterium]|nr:MAG: CPBP family intramembrane metalloprotease [Planctomycetota bacterium]
MASCSYCEAPLADSARFCPQCGEEQETYRDWMRHRERPLPPDLETRWRLLGQPIRRVALAIAAGLLAGLPLAAFLGLDQEQTETVLWAYLFLDLVLFGFILLCLWPERPRVMPSLRRLGSPWGWLAALVIGAGLPLAAKTLMGGDATEEFAAYPLPAFLSIALLPGIYEELAFRGIVLTTMRDMVKPRTAQGLTALAFAAVHLQPASLPYLFLVGLFLGYLRQGSGSLYPCMAAHALHNAVVVFA